MTGYLPQGQSDWGKRIRAVCGQHENGLDACYGAKFEGFGLALNLMIVNSAKVFHLQMLRSTIYRLRCKNRTRQANVFNMANSKAKGKRKSTGGLDRKTRGMLNLTANPVWRAFANQPVTQSTQTTIGLAGRKALYAMSNGHGKFEDFNELAVTAHSALVLAEAGYGADLMGDFTKALETILMCRLRALQGEDYSLNETDSQAVAELLELHEQQVQIVDKAQLASAIVEGYKRANSTS